MRVLVGLGNPGARYAATRHNLGFTVLDALAGLRRSIWSMEEGYCCAVLACEGQEVALVKPITYMNASGLAVRKALARFGATSEDLLVIVDDVHLPLGRIRVRRGGSDGGHNGLLSVIQSLGTEAFSRLRMGIGPLPEGEEMIDFVLGTFTFQEQETVSGMVQRAADAVRVILKDGLEKAMNQFNKIA